MPNYIVSVGAITFNSVANTTYDYLANDFEFEVDSAGANANDLEFIITIYSPNAGTTIDFSQPVYTIDTASPPKIKVSNLTFRSNNPISNSIEVTIDVRNKGKIIAVVDPALSK
jgi:hypothetical protein